MGEFDQAQYQKGYAWASSLIDTYGPHLIREMESQFGTGDYRVGFLTCLGVSLERELQG